MGKEIITQNQVRLKGTLRSLFCIAIVLMAGLPTSLPKTSKCSLVGCGGVHSVSMTSNAETQKGGLNRIRASVEFPTGLDWINVKRPLSMQSLKGKLVLLDFWTYCCINCMHVLPVLDQAEKEHGDHLVVVGVHTAKFSTEKDTSNIREAVMRYDIHHPVVNDSQQVLWKEYGVSTWPTLVLIDPEGYVVWTHSGEIAYKDLDKVLELAIKKYEKNLSGKPVQIDIESKAATPTPLRFPGKIIAHEASDRLYISDSSHHRIVVAQLDGTFVETIGAGSSGKKDGSFKDAQFNHPQGLALSKDQLFVADTENHLIRRIDLSTKQVTTIAGTGVQATSPFPGVEGPGILPKKLVRNPDKTPLGSPWDLWIEQNNIYIAMAGPHQIWKMSLDGKSIVPWAGNGSEDIVDGPLLPKRAYGPEGASFAQPSGLASDGKRLFVADSEGSSIRSMPLDEKGPVETLLGTAQLAKSRLFTFGDVDGGPGSALFQHPLGLAYLPNKLFVADTYNNKIKYIDLTKKTAHTLVGSGKSGTSDDPPLLDEPGGISIADGKLFIADTNNHRIRVWDLRSSKLTTLAIKGLQIPGKSAGPVATASVIPEDAVRVKEKPIVYGTATTKVDFEVQLSLPTGWKLNEEAPLGYVIQSRFSLKGPVVKNVVKNKVTPPSKQFSISAPVYKEANWIEVAVTYYYCQADGKGVCLADTVVFEIPIELSPSAKDPSKQILKHSIPLPSGRN